MAKKKAKKKPSRKKSAWQQRRKPKRGGMRRGSRRFTLPNSGGTLYVSPERYPRLYDWIINADYDPDAEG